MVNWSQYIAFPKWCSLQRAGFQVKEIGDPLYHVKDTLYVTLNEHNFSESTDQDGPFITSILWAVTEGAARRAINSEVEADSPEISIFPPYELLPNIDSASYRAILEQYISRGINLKLMERATYRGTDGSFVMRIIDAHPFEYYFRKEEHDGNELPFAISHSLIGK